MEFATALFKAIIFLPVWALVESPLIQLSARIVIPRRISFKAAFMLALISGGALIVVGVLLWPMSSNLGDIAETAVSLTVTLAVSSWVFGYFLTNSEGRSIGILKGGLVVLLSAILFAAILIVIAALLVGVNHAWKT
jgi:hypothetical protein